MPKENVSVPVITAKKTGFSVGMGAKGNVSVRKTLPKEQVLVEEKMQMF